MSLAYHICPITKINKSGIGRLLWFPPTLQAFPLDSGSFPRLKYYVSKLLFLPLAPGPQNIQTSLLLSPSRLNMSSLYLLF